MINMYSKFGFLLTYFSSYLVFNFANAQSSGSGVEHWINFNNRFSQPGAGAPFSYVPAYYIETPHSFNDDELQICHVEDNADHWPSTYRYNPQAKTSRSWTSEVSDLSSSGLVYEYPDSYGLVPKPVYEHEDCHRSLPEPLQKHPVYRVSMPEPIYEHAPVPELDTRHPIPLEPVLPTSILERVREHPPSLNKPEGHPVILEPVHPRPTQERKYKDPELHPAKSEQVHLASVPERYPLMFKGHPEPAHEKIYEDPDYQLISEPIYYAPVEHEPIDSKPVHHAPPENNPEPIYAHRPTEPEPVYHAPLEHGPEPMYVHRPIKPKPLYHAPPKHIPEEIYVHRPTEPEPFYHAPPKHIPEEIYVHRPTEPEPVYYAPLEHDPEEMYMHRPDEPESVYYAPLEDDPAAIYAHRPELPEEPVFASGRSSEPEPGHVLLNDGPVDGDELVIEPTTVQTYEHYVEEIREEEEEERELQLKKARQKPMTGILRLLDMLGRQPDTIVDSILDRPWDRLYRGHKNCWDYKSIKCD
ncbi:unnamed protein product [Bemisia tabaci]|uniref:Uncharacterized protein n=1 Tax=Bemisia tabaci TaxID=7038 RepID=A0A9P0G4D7_BEMTA|nr:unnamed protein product [Bemisia tabaci]